SRSCSRARQAASPSTSSSRADVSATTTHTSKAMRAAFMTGRTWRAARSSATSEHQETRPRTPRICTSRYSSWGGISGGGKENRSTRTWYCVNSPQPHFSLHRFDQLLRIVSDSLLEDRLDFADLGDRPGRIARDDDEVGLLADGNRTDSGIAAEVFRAVQRGDPD